jgi:hypothetical protein
MSGRHRFKYYRNYKTDQIILYLFTYSTFESNGGTFTSHKHGTVGEVRFQILLDVRVNLTSRNKKKKKC